MSVKKPLIVEIKRNALDDGPGIRTTVFFKGCPLACVWCQNPEAIDPGPEIIYSPGDCLACGSCLQACPEDAMDLKRRPDPIHRDRCRRCGACAAACPSRGLHLAGRYYSVEELVEELARDISFYRNSGGGITLSGGEPTLYPLYLHKLLQAVRFRRIHVNLETSGFYYRPVFTSEVLPHLDLIYFDLKLFDPDTHRRYTGRDNVRILDNLKSLARQARVPVLPRIPLVPGITAAPKNLRAIAAFLKGLGLRRAALLPYNPLWLPKAAGLGRSAAYNFDRWMTTEELERCAACFDGLELEGGV